MKKILKHTSIIILYLLVVAAVFFVPIGNNIILKRYTNKLKDFKLNATYEILAKDDECGKLIGCGNGMQYFSALLINSKMDLEWENCELEGVFLIGANDTSFDEFINGYDYGALCKTIKKKLKETANRDNLYILYSFYNAPLNSIFNDDLRAH